MLRKLLLFISILFLVLVLVWWAPQCSRPHSSPAPISTSNPPSSSETVTPEPADENTEKQGDVFSPATEPQETPQELNAPLPETPVSSGDISGIDKTAQEEPAEEEATEKPVEKKKPTDDSEVVDVPSLVKPSTAADEPEATEPAPAKENEAIPEAVKASPDEETSNGDTSDTTLPEDGKASSVYVPPRVSGEGAASAGEALFQTLTPPSSVDSAADRNPSTIVLDGVSFAYNSDQLTDDSFSVLNNVATSLKKNPEIHLEIAGYTDDRGEPLYNRILSRRRAEAVMIYLVEQGISAKRLTAVGYGSDNPIADNNTPEGRQENRRVELHIKDSPGPAASSK